MALATPSPRKRSASRIIRSPQRGLDSSPDACLHLSLTSLNTAVSTPVTPTAPPPLLDPTPTCVVTASVSQTVAYTEAITLAALLAPLCPQLTLTTKLTHIGDTDVMYAGHWREGSTTIVAVVKVATQVKYPHRTIRTSPYERLPISTGHEAAVLRYLTSRRYPWSPRVLATYEFAGTGLPRIHDLDTSLSPTWPVQDITVVDWVAGSSCDSLAPALLTAERDQLHADLTKQVHTLAQLHIVHGDIHLSNIVRLADDAWDPASGEPRYRLINFCQAIGLNRLTMLFPCDQERIDNNSVPSLFSELSAVAQL